MMARLTLLAGLLGSAWSFCAHGIGGMPDFADDNGSASVDVIVVQAALFSTNPKIGTLFGRFNWFHTAVVLKQSDGTGQDKYWTLEFDATAEGSTFAATVPRIDGDVLTWGDTNISYCLSEGLLWGREHWKKQWETVMTLTAQQARRTFSHGIGPINATSQGQYQLFAIERRSPQGSTSLVKDMTCVDGVSFFLYSAATLNHVAVRRDFRLKATHIVFPAKDVAPINSSHPEWHSSVVKGYEALVALFGGPLLHKPVDLLRYVPVHAVYDANSGTYYKIEHNKLPFVRFEYTQFPICSPPWIDDARCLQYLPAGSNDVIV